MVQWVKIFVDPLAAKVIQTRTYVQFHSLLSPLTFDVFILFYELREKWPFVLSPESIKNSLLPNHIKKKKERKKETQSPLRDKIYIKHLKGRRKNFGYLSLSAHVYAPK